MSNARVAGNRATHEEVFAIAEIHIYGLIMTPTLEVISSMPPVRQCSCPGWYRRSAGDRRSGNDRCDRKADMTMNLTPKLIEVEEGEAVLSADLSRDGRLLVFGQLDTSGAEHGITLFSLDALPGEPRTIRRWSGPCAVARLSPDQKTLAYANEDQDLVFYDLASHAVRLESFRVKFCKWISYAWHCSRLVACGTRTHVWDDDAKAIVWTHPSAPLREHASIQPPACALSPDGRIVAASGIEPVRIVLVDIETNEITARLEGATEPAQAMTIDPSGRWLAMIGVRGGIAVWDLRSGDRIASDVLNLEDELYWCAAFHPDGEHIALGTWSGFVRVIRLNDGEIVFDPDPHPHDGNVREVAFSGDGKLLVSCGDDAKGILWMVQ